MSTQTRQNFWVTTAVIEFGVIVVLIAGMLSLMAQGAQAVEVEVAGDTSEVSPISPPVNPSATQTPTPTQVPPTPTKLVFGEPENVEINIQGDVLQEEIDAYIKGVSVIQAYLCHEHDVCKYKPIRLTIGGDRCGGTGDWIILNVQRCGVKNPTELDYMSTAAIEFAMAYVIHQQGCSTNTGEYRVSALWFEGYGYWLMTEAFLWADVSPSGDTDLDFRFHSMSPEEYAYFGHLREVPKKLTPELMLDLDMNYSDNNQQKWWSRIIIGYLMVDFLHSTQEYEVLPIITLCQALRAHDGSLNRAFESIGIDRLDLYARLSAHIDAQCAKPEIPCYNREE